MTNVLSALSVLVKSQNVNYINVATLALSVFLNGPPQKKGVSPNVDSENGLIKPVKNVFSVKLSPSAPPVTNVLSVVEGRPVGARLQNFWQVWAQKGSSPRVVSILKEGYNLPFSHKPPLTGIPLIRSGYANPRRNSYLQEALHSLLQKRAVEKVKVQSSLGFYNRLFIVPKPNQKWRPILDLSALNRFLKVKTFKMETPESIRLSLQPGEWFTSLDFSDAYFHIPITPNSRKFLRSSFQNQTFQFRALPFGLSSAPMEFTIVVKEVKLMAQARNIQMYQYLDDWLIRATDRGTCFQDTQTLLALCQELGWVVNLRKSELEPKQIFNFVGYQYDLVQGVVRPTPERWEALNSKISSLLERTSCSVRELMSLIGLLTATEKQVTSGRLHMRPIQWHLKNHWHIPESLEKVIPMPRSLHPHLLW